MQCYTELIPPTAVTHAVSLPFLGPGRNNLVVAKTSLLQVFDIKASPNGTTDTLYLVGEYPLSGAVTALSPVEIANTKAGGSALLIALKDAKLSLVEWDPANWRISTISIHYYEGEGIVHQPFGPEVGECESILTVDPSSRCAALKFGPRALAILPFRQTGDELGEDGEADGLDTEMNTAPLKRTSTSVEGQDAGDTQPTPYQPSFVLPLTTLDSSLTHPIHLAFLHKYREPTFGILAGVQQPSNALLDERKDCISYTVLTLDLENRAVTPLISITNLPAGLWKVLPLPDPTGGALLVGTNELVHVDQAGKTNAVAVNEYAKQMSNFAFSDQSDLNMKLEGCEAEGLSSGDVLLILRDGSTAVLSFKLSGRNVSGLTVSRVPAESGGLLAVSAPSCITSLQNQTLFVGSEDGNSRLLGWAHDLHALSRKRSHAQMLDQDNTLADDEDNEDMDEDDLYAPSADAAKRRKSETANNARSALANYEIKFCDELQSLGPINDTCFGKPPNAGKDKLELLAGIGRGRSSRLAYLGREIAPDLTDIWNRPELKDVWSAHARKASDGPPQQLLFAYDGNDTKAYSVRQPSHETTYVTLDDPDVLKEKTGTEWEHDGETLFVGTIANDTRIVQCRRHEIRIYDSDLGLSQIIPMLDEETDAELKIVTCDFQDQYILVLLDDSSVQVLQVDKSGDAEPLEAEGVIKERKWISACLYDGSLTGGEPAAFMLGGDGGLHVFSLPDLKPVYMVPTLSTLPPLLSPDAAQRRGARATLTELLVTDIGAKESKQPYLILRNAEDGLVLYEPFHYDASSSDSTGTGFANLKFRKVPSTYTPKFDPQLDTEEPSKPARLTPIRTDGRHAVYVPGSSPSLILRGSASLPKILGLDVSKVASLVHISAIPGHDDRFALLDKEGVLKSCTLPEGAEFDTGWCVNTISIGEEVRQLAFHAERGVYVVATCRSVDFVFPEEDGRHEKQDDINLRPQVPQYTLHLLSATTRTVIQSLELEPLELVTGLKVMQVEVSEQSHEQRAMVVISTASLRGEDMPARGTLLVYDVIDVVPDPDKPESGIRLKQFSREETKGAITALEQFPGGLIGTAQGQKLMIRGLKEDGSCLPVAFLDAQAYTTTLKTLGRTGLWMSGDASQGLWVGGWTEEPYRLQILGKSRTGTEIVQAEFLPWEGGLYAVVVDGEGLLSVLQYDPESPKSLGGRSLLRRGEWSLGGAWSTGLALVPSSLKGVEAQVEGANGVNGHDEEDGGERKAKAPDLYHVLATFASGAVGLITPLEESAYRRLTALQTFLANTLEHAAGLNPRAFRAPNGGAEGARGFVDGGLVGRISELGLTRRGDALARAGMDGWGLRGDLEVVGGKGLGYLR